MELINQQEKPGSEQELTSVLSVVRVSFRTYTHFVEKLSFLSLNVSKQMAGRMHSFVPLRTDSSLTLPPEGHPYLQILVFLYHIDANIYKCSVCDPDDIGFACSQVDWTAFHPKGFAVRLDPHI